MIDRPAATEGPVKRFYGSMGSGTGGFSGPRNFALALRPAGSGIVGIHVLDLMNPLNRLTGPSVAAPENGS